MPIAAAIFLIVASLTEVKDEAETHKATWNLDNKPKNDETAGSFYD